MSSSALFVCKSKHLKDRLGLSFPFKAVPFRAFLFRAIPFGAVLFGVVPFEPVLFGLSVRGYPVLGSPLLG